MATTFNQARGISLLDDGSVSNLKEVYAIFNSQKIPAQYNPATGLWSIETAGPATSSWDQPGHVYSITLYAEDLAGNIATLTNADPTYGSELQIRVLETTKPVATIVSPTQGAVLGDSTVEFELDLVDYGGSGLNMETFVFSINGRVIDNEYFIWSNAGDGHITAVLAIPDLPDGQNLVTVDVTDFDGNVAIQAETTFVISTIAPTLTVTKPAEDLITNVSPLLIEGYTAPGTSAVSIANVTVNGVAVPVNPDGSFSYKYNFTSEGETILEIKATDTIGKSTVVVRKIVYDTTLPLITDVVAESIVVNVGEQIKVTFKVVDPGDLR